MRLHVVSDLHLERGGGPPPVADADVLVLAGDIGAGVAGVEAAAEWWPSKPVVYVGGNHEPYGGGLPGITTQLRRTAAAFGGRVQVLERDEAVIAGVRFLGCTLWSDFLAAGEAQRERSMAICSRVVNDYEHIAWTPGGRTLTPADTLRIHDASRRWLQERLATPHPGPTVVVTHHAPLPPPAHVTDPVRLAIAGAFASDLRPLMDGDRVPLWIHGHVHRWIDTEVGGTRVLCNPRGYPHEPVAAFDPHLVVEV